ncbi:MAG: hypothetical protein LBS99_07410 [Clostridiales bacterium]|jgi:hypothetical protein|nr:hypothetical protein [Clostridiales bacterium]
MKKKLILILTLITACVAVSLGSATRAASSANAADWGRLTADLSESGADFAYYSEAGEAAPFFIRDGALYATGRAEQKAILKGHNSLSDFEVEADFSPLYKNGTLDVGFYVLAANPVNALDGIRGYNVNLERGTNASLMLIKIHRFNQGYLGGVAEVSVRVKSDKVHLRVAVASKVINVYVYGADTPVLTHTAASGYSSGSVGIRVFRGAGAKIENFTLAAAGIAVDKLPIRALIARAETLDGNAYTVSSLALVTAALGDAETAESGNSQAAVDAAIKALSKALDGLVKKYSFGELTGLIAQGEVFAASAYTVNSYGSLSLVLTRARALNAASGEDAISETAEILEGCITTLIPYAF